MPRHPVQSRVLALLHLLALWLAPSLAAQPVAADAPRVLFTAATLAELQTRLSAGEPRASAYRDALEAAAPVWHATSPEAPATFYVPLFYVDTAGHRARKAEILRAATVAHGLALRYRLGGTEADAAHAVAHLRPWFRDVTYQPGADTQLVFSYTFPLMIYAADLLRPSPAWTTADRADFDAFLAGTALSLNTAASSNNVGSWGNLLRFAIAAHRDDDALLATAISRHRTFINVQIDADGVMPAEVTRNNGLGEQGIGYTHFSIGPLAVAAQIALHRDIDLFNYVSPLGRTLESAWRRVVPWTAEPATFPYFTGSDLGQMANVTTTAVDYFDQAATGLFPIRMGYFELLQARWPIPAADAILADLGPGGLDPAAMQWLGLTHSAPADLALPATVATLDATPGPARIDLAWTPAARAAGYHVERRTAASAPWTLLAVLPADATSLSDPALYPDTEYTYRVRPFNFTGEALFWTPSAPARTPPAIAAALDALLADTFTDGERATQSLPTSSAWYFGSATPGATLGVTDGQLGLNQGASNLQTVAATTYFAPPEAPVELANGESLTVRFDLALVLDGTTVNDGLRLGLYDSGARRVLADLATNNGADSVYNAWRGYSLFTTLGANTNGTLTVRERAGASEAIVGTAAHTTVGASVAAPSLLNATTHLANTLTITRTATGVTVRGQIAGVSIEVTDPTPAATRFDSFSIWAHPNPLGANGRLLLDNLTIQKTLAPALPSAPAPLTATQTALGETRLDWSAPEPAPLGYRLERAGPDGVWLLLAALPSTATTYLDATLTPGATHTYRLVAYGEAGPAATAPELALLADTSHRAWRRLHFATPEDAGPAANLADPDADGLPNLLEYALATDPLSPGSEPNVRITNIGLALQIEFLRARADLTYEVLASSTLEPGSWQVIATNPGVVSASTPVTVTEPVSINSRRFLRLRVTAPVSP